MTGIHVDTPSLWRRFIEKNKQICDNRIAPRLYPIGHVAALDCLLQRWVTLSARPRDSTFLEFGCGRTFHYSRLFERDFSSRLATDIDEISQEDAPTGVVFRRCSEEQVPFEACSVDVIMARSVMEHLRDPAVTFRELSRVMKPGATLYMNLPNRWDYVSLGARILKGRKSGVLRRVIGMDYEDFPVYYRCNTRRDLQRSVEAAGLRIELFRPLPSAPVYLSFLLPAYVAGAIYQFLIAIFGLDFLQPSFAVVIKKPGAGNGLPSGDRR